MQGKNRYFRRSHLSEAKFRLIIRSFAHDLPASKIAELGDVSCPTINHLFFKLRTRIAQLCDASSPLSGEVEVDKFYFWVHCVRRKRVVGPGVERWSPGFWNVRGRSTRRSSQTFPRSRYRPRSGAR